MPSSGSIFATKIATSRIGSRRFVGDRRHRSPDRALRDLAEFLFDFLARDVFEGRRRRTIAPHPGQEDARDMNGYEVMSSITSKRTTVGTRRQAAEFLCQEAQLDDPLELYWQDRHSSMGNDLHWEILGYRWDGTQATNSMGLNEGFVVGQVTEFDVSSSDAF
jgi:hypothetical protein